MDKLEKNLFKHFTGYLEERDEYQQGVIYKMFATTHMYSLYLISFCLMVSMFFDSINQTLTFGTLALFFILQFNGLYVFIKLRESDVDKTEFDDNTTYSTLIKKLREKSILAGIQFGFSIFVMMEYIFPTLWGEIINIGLLEIIFGICTGTGLGVIMYISGKSRLTKVDND